LSKAEGYANFICAIGKPRHAELKGDRAYIVVPASLKYDIRGKPAKESGSVWTVALEKKSSGWRIVAWTWAEGTDISVPQQRHRQHCISGQSRHMCGPAGTSELAEFPSVPWAEMPDQSNI
jgi:hypothetical protein